MKRLMICLLACTATPALSDQESRANDIARLSVSSMPSATPSDTTAPQPAAKILLDGCAMTIASASLNTVGGMFLAYSFQSNLEDVTFGSTLSETPYDMVDPKGEDLAPYGSLPFRVTSGISAKTHGQIPSVLPPEEAITYPVVYSDNVDEWRYTISEATEPEMAALTRALLTYQQDFCSPAS